MYLKFYSVLCVTAFFLDSPIQAADPCPFNSQCECESEDGIDGWFVKCNDMTSFPSFSTYSSKPINLIIVNGNFTSIPGNAFYQLRSLYQADVYIQRSLVYPDVKLEMSTDAFQTFIPNTIANLEFDYLAMNAVPSSILSNFKCDQFSIAYGSLAKIRANDFVGLTTGEIAVYSTGLTTIDDSAFNGLQFDPDEGLTLFFNYNNLVEISPAFKPINVSTVYLMYNQITRIQDFAFSSCNQPSGCSNMLTNLFISNNPITTVDDNAFANLPNMMQLDLSQLNLTAIPVTSISKLAPSLQIVDFTDNQITTIAANSFYNFQRLTSLALSWNPVVDIEVGAFNGMAAMQALIIEGLVKLTSVDLLVTYGMSQVASLQFQYCTKLTTVLLSDATKLPQTLTTVSFATGNDIRTVDSEVQLWLSQSSSNSLDISNNVNFVCNSSISWMAKFAVCAPVQIFTNGARCANTNTDLSDYLSTFSPSC